MDEIHISPCYSTVAQLWQAGALGATAGACIGGVATFVVLKRCQAKPISDIKQTHAVGHGTPHVSATAMAEAEAGAAAKLAEAQAYAVMVRKQEGTDDMAAMRESGCIRASRPGEMREQEHNDLQDTTTQVCTLLAVVLIAQLRNTLWHSGSCLQVHC